MASKKKKRKRKGQKRIPDGQRKLLSQIKEKGLLRGKKILHSPPGEVKMSEVILDFIEPYLEYAKTYEHYQKLITIALVAWNSALLPEDEQKAMVKDIVGSQKLPKSDAEDMKGIVEELMERKKKYFAKYTRPIIDYHLSDEGDKFHLSVVSVLTVKDKK